MPNASLPVPQYAISLCLLRFHRLISLMGGIWPLGQVGIQYLLDPPPNGEVPLCANCTHSYGGSSLCSKFRHHLTVRIV